MCDIYATYPGIYATVCNLIKNNTCIYIKWIYKEIKQIKKEVKQMTNGIPKKYLCNFKFTSAWFSPNKSFQKEIETTFNLKDLKTEIITSIKNNKDPYKLVSIKEIN